VPYSLTVDGYTFANPPEDYRKVARLANSPQTAFNKRATNFYQSDSQELQYRAEGTLALDPALGGTDDLAELEHLQDIAIEGGEVEVEFDPFFSGKCVIEDDPFRQSGGESTYSFTFTVNVDSTDSSAYPSHSSPETGNTFEYGHLDLGYDPTAVQQNYERQTEKVKRLQGIARSVDTDGLIPTVTVSGMIDGGGQAELWETARKNRLAYLSAEFQNGWALVDSLSIRNSPAAPDYLTGLFQYDLDLLVVMDPGSGIGEAATYVDRDVQASNTYVSNCDDDGVYKRLGTDSDDYPFALDYRVSGGTGKLAGAYIEWEEDVGTLDQNATNYLWVDDPDADGYGTVDTGTNGFPADTVHLYEVDTGSSSVDDIRDQRSCLTGTRLTYDDLGDLNFIDTLSVDERLLSHVDQMRVAGSTRWRGIARLSDTMTVAEGKFAGQGIASFTGSASVLDGGSAFQPNQGVTRESTTYGSASDYDSAVSEAGVVHEPTGDYPGDDVVQLGYPPRDRGGGSLELHFPMDEDAGASVISDIVGGHDHANNGTNPGATGIHNTDRIDFDGDGELVSQSSFSWYGSSTNVTWIAVITTTTSADKIYYAKDNAAGTLYFRLNDTSGHGTPNVTVRFDGANFTNATGDQAGTNDGNKFWTKDPAPLFDGTPHILAVSINQGTRGRIWIDDTLKCDADMSGSSGDGNTDSYIGDFSGGGYDIEGTLDVWQQYSRELTQSDLTEKVTALTDGQILLATKSFSAALEPDIENATYDLKGESITVDVIGSPGTASEETVTQTLDGSTSYSLNWADSHTDFRIKVYLNSSDSTVSPTFDDLDLITPAPSGDADQNENTEWTLTPGRYDTGGNEYEGGGVVVTYE
jgi:hypothetical protein